MVNVKAGDNGEWAIGIEEWPGFSLASLLPAVESNGNLLEVSGVVCSQQAEKVRVDYELSGICKLSLEAHAIEGGGIRLQGMLRNLSGETIQVGKVSLLEAGVERAAPSFGVRADRVVMLEQSNYRADIVSLVSSIGGDEPAAAEANAGSRPSGRGLTSQHVWLAYDRDARQALLAGFETGERWNGTISVNSERSGAIHKWSVGFDSADLLLPPGAEAELERLVLLQGRDPHGLLERYGDMVAACHRPALPAETPVSWCSWYPYRLGVSEERILETARIAARRLQPLGLTIIEADLGWEKDYLPNSFEENEQFSRGFEWLSRQLEQMGFRFGCWKAPYQISEFDPLVGEHPEWLIPGEDGQPASIWTWFWEPHGHVYALDLTHPGAQDWLRRSIRGLAERGIKYFKADFIGQPALGITQRRFDRSIAAGAETGRIGARIIREELPEALILNCGGPEMPGTGQWPLLYTCQDTGNTGVLSWEFQKLNFRALACHLWKNRRWGVIQGSCLCVGLPGTLEEARIRATAAFLSGGQIDISDTLATLPEDRWAVLEATLPPLGRSARAIDLFEPLYDPGSYDYVALCKGEDQALAAVEHPPGSVWHLRVERGWDSWELVGVFVLEPQGDQLSPTRFKIPLERLGLGNHEKVGAYEFWSGQYLGEVPARRTNPGCYEHPGDMQDLAVGDSEQAFEIAFTGPAVKLLCLRPLREHPWVAGTSFHQSCGAELEDVTWCPEQNVLSGRLLRPAGHSGYIQVSGAGWTAVSATVDGNQAALLPGANGAWKLPLVLRQDSAHWSIRFRA